MHVRLNAEIAARLEDVARVLADQDANPYRVEAYRRAARTIREPRNAARCGDGASFDALEHHFTL